MRGIAFAAMLVAVCMGASGYDVAAYVWPAFHPAARWAELGLFKDGKGEWQNQYESCKRFPEDNQLAKPLWGYESESDPVAVARKIDAATSAGVNVFIYDWYWYGGRPFLQEALDNGFLKAQNRERMKFYLMWANHDVTKLWDNKVGGKEKSEVMWRADYTDEDWRNIVAQWTKRYFREPNYYKIDGKPVLSIYDAWGFCRKSGTEKAKERIAYLRAETEKAGFPGLHLQILCTAYFPTDPCYGGPDIGADSYTLYQWTYKTGGRVNSTTEPMLTYREWGELAMSYLDDARKQVEARGAVYFPNITVGWDTNARYPHGEKRNIVRNSNPADFEHFSRIVRDWVDRNTPAGRPKLITLNAWNEWTEGSYLEPDDRFGYGYLNALRRVFK